VIPDLPDRETLRLHQANERTLLAWIRTTLAMMGLGFVVARVGLLSSVSLAVGVASATAGVIGTLAALARYRRVSAAIERHEVGRPEGDAWILVVGGLVAALGVALVALLFSER